MAATLVQKTFDEIDTTLATYINDVATSVIASITPVVTTLLLIYVTLWGWKVITGNTSELVTDGFNRVVKLTLIVSLAVNLGYYNSFVVNFLFNLPSSLANLASTTGGATGIGGFLDSILMDMWDLGTTFQTKAELEAEWGIPNLSLLLSAYVIWLLGLALTIVGAFLLVLSKLALSALLAVGPIFIVLIMFEPTKRLFESWIMQCLNFIFISMLVGAILKLIVTLLSNYLSAYTAVATPSNVEVKGAIPAIFLSVMAILVLLQVTSIASSLAHGISLSSMLSGRRITGSMVDSVKGVGRFTYKAGKSTVEGAKSSRNVAKAITAKLRRGNTITGS
jgi:type IV secretion system protein VirB6